MNATPLEGQWSYIGVSDDGAWVAEINPSGELVLRPATHSVDPTGKFPVKKGVPSDESAASISLANAGAIPPVSFSSDGRRLAFAREQEGTGGDIFVVDLSQPSKPHAVVAWPGSEDRPSLSPDGRRLAFVSNRTGISSVYVIEVDRPGAAAVQLTNLGIEVGRGPIPETFIPPPDSPPVIRWEGDFLTWTSGGEIYRVAVPGTER